MSTWIKMFATQDGNPEPIDQSINKWLISNPSINLIDIKYKLHYNNNVYLDVVIVVYESSQEPYVDWKKGDEQA